MRCLCKSLTDFTAGKKDRQAGLRLIAASVGGDCNVL